MAIKRPLDSFYVYQFLKKLSTPFDETDAYELGIIDDKGKVLKKQKDLKTREEKEAFNRFDILVNNLKKLLSKIPFGKTMLGRYTAALFLLKESENTTIKTLEEDFWAFVEKQDLQELNERVRYEDAPTMSTGAAVAGTGDDPVHWRHPKFQPGMKGDRKRYRTPLDGITFLKRKKLKDLEERVSLGDLKKVEQYADRLFGAVGIDVEFTRHFIDRVNDARNVKNITPAELVRLFKQTYRKHGKKIPQLGPDAEAVIQDMRTDINMPFVLKWDSDNQEIDLVAKTVMRKKGFRTTSQQLKVEELIKKITKERQDD